MNEVYKIVADTATGITTCDAFESCPVSYADFVDSLRYLGDDEIIGCIVTADQLAELDAAYGVREL